MAEQASVSSNGVATGPRVESLASPLELLLAAVREGNGQLVVVEGAVYGVMATTTRLAKGAREYCQARQYRVRGAEREHVREWLRSMTSHGEVWQPQPSPD